MNFYLGDVKLKRRQFLLITTCIVGACSIIYELLISTVSSYFLGDSIQQFSLIIGVYLATMGLGSYLSRFVNKNPLFTFVKVEMILGVIGGFSVPLCYLYFNYADQTGYQWFVLFWVSLIGTLTGMEIPLLTQVLGDNQKEDLSDVLTLDYAGALVATLLFPFVLLPFLGVYRSSILFGAINVLVGLVSFILLVKKDNKRKAAVFNILGVGLIGLMAIAFSTANKTIDRWNSSIYKQPVILQKDSPYQELTLTKTKSEFRLYLNGAIQFSSLDEYRYHEGLVHVGAQQLEKLESVLILGGGEGLAAREVLKYLSVQTIDIIDLDPLVTKIATENPLFLQQNQRALLDPRVAVYNADAFAWLKNAKKKYDLIIVDLPDPSSDVLSRLYSQSFYMLCSNRLNQGGLLITQATSPTLATSAFWCVDKTILEIFPHSYPFHVDVPSFGDWGFVIGSRQPIDFSLRYSVDMKLIDEEFLDHCFYFPKDLRKVRDDIEPNRLDQPTILQYYKSHLKKLSLSKK